MAARSALCHEWLSQRRGSEKTFEAMARALPEADLFALTCDLSVRFALDGRRVRTTLLDRLGPLRDRRDLHLPLMPLAWRYASRRTYDLVVTSSHACAKGFWPGRSALHLCYCYTPMRYAWLASVDERRRRGPATRAIEDALRSWDVRAANWVDDFAAISSAVSQRITDFYGRSARVIHPPVDTGYFLPPAAGPAPGGFALVVSRLVPYKRIDLALRACHQIGYPLVVAGSGADEARLRALSAQLGSTVDFVGSPSDEALRELYRNADVLIFCGEEDFGIVMVEAQACGTPVVALGRGGSVDIVVPGRTGLLVEDQDVDAIGAAVESVLNADIDPQACRLQAERFSAERFDQKFGGWVSECAAARGLEVGVNVSGDRA